MATSSTLKFRVTVPSTDGSAAGRDYILTLALSIEPEDLFSSETLSLQPVLLEEGATMTEPEPASAVMDPKDPPTQEQQSTAH